MNMYQLLLAASGVILASCTASPSNIVQKQAQSREVQGTVVAITAPTRSYLNKKGRIMYPTGFAASGASAGDATDRVVQKCKEGTSDYNAQNSCGDMVVTGSQNNTFVVALCDLGGIYRRSVGVGVDKNSALADAWQNSANEFYDKFWFTKNNWKDVKDLKKDIRCSSENLMRVYHGSTQTYATPG